ncbi:MAG: tryptophan synthase subunit alpha [Candidatus Omnitrophota bacterium]
MNRIDKKFKELRRKKKKAFIAFLTAGYPNLSTTAKLIPELEKSGVDIVELGIPFSDPIADGPVIQKSSYEALKKGATLGRILKLVAQLRCKTQMPLAAMSYYNPILSYGPARFVKEAVRVGLDAVIVPDLPPEEEKDFVQAAKKSGLHIIQFIAPTTSRQRARMIVRHSGGFIYFVSLTGVTGMRRQLPAELKSQLRSVKRIAGKIPVCAGFGVSTPEQVKAVGSFCDGVIVGSAIVKSISQNTSKRRLVSNVGAFVRALTRKI